MRLSSVRKANKASASQISEAITLYETLKESTYCLSVAASSELSTEERDTIWNIFQDGMHDLYTDSSFGWDPPSKREELFDPLSRFILVTEFHEPSQSLSPSPILGYTMFRFDDEDGIAVVYCYELHISKGAQHRGLGRLLTQKLVQIGRKWGMHKVMLTVLKANAKAMSFYRSVGFTTDCTSPEYQPENEDGWVDDEEAESEIYDYEILSKEIADS